VNNYLIDTLLRDSDVMSMAHGLECRPILLDHELMETAFALPDGFKIKEGLKKAIFIDAVKDIIPESVYNRKKTGFEMPLASWMSRPLLTRMKEAFQSDVAAEVFSRKYLRSAISSLERGSVLREYWADLVLIRWMLATGASIRP
jgi:asparagine synthase (glutamine-hydrolysing)